MDAVESPLSSYRVTLYLQPHAAGRVTVPTLRLPWYDAGRGQVAGLDCRQNTDRVRSALACGQADGSWCGCCAAGDCRCLVAAPHGALATRQMARPASDSCCNRYCATGARGAPVFAGWRARSAQPGRMATEDAAGNRALRGWRTGGCAGSAMLRTRVVDWRGRCTGGLGVCLVERAAGIAFSPGLTGAARRCQAVQKGKGACAPFLSTGDRLRNTNRRSPRCPDCPCRPRRFSVYSA